MNSHPSNNARRSFLLQAAAVWIAFVLHRTFRIWFDWETVRFFVIPRPGRYRWLEPWLSGWVDLSDYGITAASLTLRPLMTWSFQMESIFFGPWAPGYHLLNFAAHLSCAWLLFRFLHRHGIDFRAACLGAMFFALHPVTTQPLWILGDRAEVFVLLGGLVALNTYRSQPVIALFGTLLALLCKETAVTIPLWLAACDLLLPDPPNLTTAPAHPHTNHRSRSIQLLRRIAPHIAITTVYVIYRSVVFAGLGGYRSLDHTRITHLPDVLSQNIAWLLTIPHSRFIPTAIFLIVLVSIPFAPRMSRFSILWFCIFLMPVHNLCNKWYLYTPAAALATGLAAWCDAGFRRPRMIKPVTALFLLLIAVCSVLSHAELLHQQRNAAVPIALAQRLRAILPTLPANARVRFITTASASVQALKGHYFDPATFEVRKDKTPLESIVWDLNATRYTRGGVPVWTRSVEAALQLLYDDIGIRATLSDDFDRDKTSPPDEIRVIYDPVTGSLALGN